MASEDDTPPTIDEIKKLLASSNYGPSMQPQLEAYVKGEATGKVPYFMQANRTLLKLYQFYPNSEREDFYTALILLLSVLEFPSTTDFLAVSCLIPERRQVKEPCASLVHCAGLLDSCQFTEFWSAFDGIAWNDVDDGTLESLAKSSRDRLRGGVLQVLALSFRTAPASVVLTATQLDSVNSLLPQFSQSVESIEEGDHPSVTFVATADNTKRNRVFQEGVSFSAISNMLTKVARE